MKRSVFKFSVVTMSFIAVFAASLPRECQAVITYVDATNGVGGNTTLLDGSVWETTTTSNVIDGLWNKRAFANGGTAYEGGLITGFTAGSPTENAHMVRTTISGLNPGASYDIYGYFWSALNTNWQFEGTLNAARINDGGTPGNVLDDSLSQDEGQTFTRLKGQANKSQALPALASRFDSTVMVLEDDRGMFEAPLGSAVANGSGEIHVYVDDWENDANYRAWYDGVGYEPSGLPRLTVNRDTGEMTYTSATARNIVGYSIQSPLGALTQAGWKSIADNYDSNAVGPGAGLVDADDPWVKLSQAGSFTDLSEAELNLFGPQNGGTLPANTPISFGNTWLPYYTEDVTLDLLLNDSEGTVESVRVVFEGNGSSQFIEGDFDFNGSVGPEDYAIFIDSLFAPITGTAVETYALGDLNRDLAVDYADLVAYRTMYDAANGAGAFQLMLSGAPVPEPSTVVALLTAIGGALVIARRRGRSLTKVRTAKSLASAALAMVALSSSAVAKITYVDAVPNSNNGGTTMNTGINTTLIDGTAWNAVATNGGDGLYFYRTNNNWGNNGIYETNGSSNNAANAEDAPVLITTVPGLDPNARYFTYGFFWSNVSGTSNNWRLKITNDPADVHNNETPGNLLDDFLPDDPRVSFSGRGSATSTQARQVSVSEFTDPSVKVGTGNERMLIAELGIHSPNHAGQINFYVDDLANQTSTTTRTWYDGVGYQKVLDLTLEVNTANGQARIKNLTGATVDLSYYKITSATNQLNPAGWNTLDMQNVGAIDGPDPGDTAGDALLEGWDMAGGSSTSLLSEVNFLSTTALANAASFNLGSAFVPGITSGVTFEFQGQQGLLTGIVEFIDENVLPGDYNNSGTVEAGDYTVWKNSFGQSGLDLDADGNGDGVVNLADYTVWRDNLGATSMSPLSNTTVPEPAAWSAFLLAAMVLGGRRLLAGTFRSARLWCVAITTIAGTAGVASAAYTLDRQYLLGDDSLEGGDNGAVVGSANSGPLSAGTSADSFGPLQFTYLDLTVGGTPQYVGVSSVGGGRPLATPGSQGVRFNGSTDYLDGIPLNRPDELALILRTSPSETVYPLNYNEIRGRGMQMWVYPEQAGLDAGNFQSIVSDSIFAGGPAINALGQWTQINSGHITSGPAATVQVVGNTWYHVMQHVYVHGTPGAPTTVAGSGSTAEFDAVLYVDGMAVSVNNDSMGFTRVYDTEVNPPVIVSNPQPNYDHRLVVGGSEVPNTDTAGPTLYGNFFNGVIDDLEMYVYGDNSNVGGQNWGSFNLFEDNKWIKNAIDTDPNLNGTLAYGDLDRDGDVDMDDVDDFIAGWLSRKEFQGAHGRSTAGDWDTWTWGDMDHDGVVYLKDLHLMHQALVNANLGGFNAAWLSGGRQVPEPSTALMILVAGASLCLIRRASKAS